MKRLFNIIAVCLLCTILVGCSSAKSITNKEFGEILSKEGYQINDASSQYKNNNLVEIANVASKDHHQIEFYVSKDSSHSKKLFESDIQIFGEKNNDTIVTKDSKNAQVYSIIRNGKYIYISRINNTLVFAYVDESEKDIVDGVIKKIGY